MEAATVLLAQALTLSGLVGASGAYAGIIRRRRDQRIALIVAAQTSEAAVERVDRQLAMSRLEHTFIRSAYRRPSDRSSTRRR